MGIGYGLDRATIRIVWGETIDDIVIAYKSECADMCTDESDELNEFLNSFMITKD